MCCGLCGAALRSGTCREDGRAPLGGGGVCGEGHVGRVATELERKRGLQIRSAVAGWASLKCCLRLALQRAVMCIPGSVSTA